MICLTLHAIGIKLDHKQHWIYPQKTNTGQQVLYFSGPKIWTKISRSTKNVKTTASFNYVLKREILNQLCR